MLMSYTGHTCLLHQALYHATLRRCCHILQLHGMPCEMGMVSGACDDLQHTAGPIFVLEERCGAILVELPGSQNLLWTGCSCTGYELSPLQYS